MIKPKLKPCKHKECIQAKLSSVNWWTKTLQAKRTGVRKKLNWAKKAGAWETYRTTLTEYSLAIRKVRMNSVRQSKTFQPTKEYRKSLRPHDWNNENQKTQKKA